MPRFNFKSEDGSAVIEFLGFALLLQVPILLFANQINLMQRDQLAAQTIARQLVQSVVLSQNAADATTRASYLLADLESNFDLTPERLKYRVSCSPADCFAADSVATVDVWLGGTHESASEAR